MKNRFCFFSAILMVALMSFGGRAKTQEGVPTNFSISLVTVSHGQGPVYLKQVANDKGVFFEMRCDSMRAYDNDFNPFFEVYHDIDIVDFTAGKVYNLKPETKTGKVENFDVAKADMYKGFNRTIRVFLFAHNFHKENLEATGKEKIIGRDVTVYTDTAAVSYDTDRKFWIDDQYGFALKSVEIHGENNTTMYVTEFIVGGATVEGLVNLGEYKLEK